MAAKKRIYLVTDLADDGAQHLVRAGSGSQAIRHIVRSKYLAEVAKQDDIVRLVAMHELVQDAGEEQEEPPIPTSIRSNRAPAKAA